MSTLPQTIEVRQSCFLVPFMIAFENLVLVAATTVLLYLGFMYQIISSRNISSRHKLEPWKLARKAA